MKKLAVILGTLALATTVTAATAASASAATTYADMHVSNGWYKITGLQYPFDTTQYYRQAVWSTSPCVNGTTTGPGGTLMAAVATPFYSTLYGSYAATTDGKVGNGAYAGELIYGSVQTVDGRWWSTGSCYISN